MEYELLGKCAFMRWDEMDGLMTEWAQGCFGEHVRAEFEGRGLDCGIVIWNVTSQDTLKFDDLFDKYDREGDYTAREYFGQQGWNKAIIPEPLAIRIISELLSEKTELDMVGTVASCENGIFFMEEALEDE